MHVLCIALLCHVLVRVSYQSTRWGRTIACLEVILQNGQLAVIYSLHGIASC